MVGREDEGGRIKGAHWACEKGKVAMPTPCCLSGGRSPGVTDQGEEVEM